MAGLSIVRRRKAWFKGIAYGASGFGRCRYEVPKLKEIFERGVLHGKLHAETPYVKAIVEQEQRRRKRPVSTQRQTQRGRRPGVYSASGNRQGPMRRPGPFGDRGGGGGRFGR